MKNLLIFLAVVGSLAKPAFAHRLDEYLQATIFSFQSGSIHATLRMVPGVTVAPGVIAKIDRNGDGILSDEEQQEYANEVLRDLLLKQDAQPLEPHLESFTFPSIEQMNAGVGEIELAFSAPLPCKQGRHELSYENHHLPRISVYLVNSLVPEEATLQLGHQTRSQNQSSYTVTFGGAELARPRTAALGGLSGAFHLGARHIAEGTDHLLFLLTLLLPAPLLAIRGQWAQRATVRQSLVQILRIVTAFTLGHSLTLALSSFGLVQLPSRPVEVMIAVSILISAIHAARPLFPRREALVAAFFGLVHGLAFASALNELGVTGWYRGVSLLGFNVGIEAMQFVVIAAALPPLLLVSRTTLYTAFRYFGALFAGIASIAWMMERVTNSPTLVGRWVQNLANHSIVFDCAFWSFSVLVWLARNQLSQRDTCTS